MPDDYYTSPDTTIQNAPGDTAKPAKPQGDDEQQEMEGDTALVPKSIFRGKIPEVGQDCHFKCEHLFEDEVELSWVKDGDENKPARGKRSTMDDVNDTFDKMAGPSTTDE